jgi:signal transduction histidine kinase
VSKASTLTPAKVPVGSGAWPAMAPRARILLVDDDERNLLALSEVLEPLADVVTATSGRLALRELLKDDFAVILLDVFMPEMDGYETAALIRQRPQTSRIPIIFLSAVNKETEHLMRGYAMGAVDYVFKPVDPIVLKSKVAVFVDLFLLRQQVAGQARAEQALREEKLQADTERLAVERELQEARLRQAAILESLPLALYEAWLDDEGHLHRRFVGGDVAKIVGGDAEALTSGSLRWCDRIAETEAAELERRVAACADASITSHYRWRRTDGTTTHVIDQCVRSPEGAATWVGTLVDVTTQRELEEQLVHARKAEALGQLTGGVAHDFNNLLAAVLGGLRLLETRLELGERERKILVHMRHAAESGAELVRRLMAFARKQELVPTSVDPHSLCRSVAGLVEHTLGAFVTVDWRLPKKTPQLYVDEAQLELALVNLLINARDAMPDGGKIVVAIEETKLADGAGEPRDYLQIRVSDEGDGIPPDLIERVTEPFFTTKAAGKGTGLGLSMVAGFVEQSGGLFRIRSEPGKGTEVDLILPTTTVSSEPETAREAEQAPEISVGSVMVVDDDESVRLIVSEQLRDLGLDVEVAEDGQKALAMLANGSGGTEFVLTDFTMPGLDGMALLAAIREKWPRIKGAIMTGNPQESLTRCDPGIPVIHKPIDTGELKRLLSEA